MEVKDVDNEKRFYVYVWIRGDTNEVFYVGKGSGNRYKDLDMRNKHFLNIVKKIGKNNCIQEFLATNLTEPEAFELEKFYIAKYRENGIPLTNISNGGDGSSGWFEHATPEEQERHREVSKSFLGKRHSEETKEKMRQSALGRHILSEEAKHRIGSANSRPVVVYSIQQADIVLSFDSFSKCVDYFHKQNPLLGEAAIRRALRLHNGEILGNPRRKYADLRFYYKDEYDTKTQSTIESIM